MYGLIREEYPFPVSGKVLARHIYSRMFCGKIVIVTDHPKTLMSPLRKQWFKLIYKAQIERSRTLHGTRIVELSTIIGRMQSLRFKAGWEKDDQGADVYLATPEQLLRWAPECGTLYITYPIKGDQLHLISAWMRPNSLVVIFGSVSL